VEENATSHDLQIATLESKPLYAARNSDTVDRELLATLRSAPCKSEFSF
jgi:hypothetical protein